MEQERHPQRVETGMVQGCRLRHGKAGTGQAPRFRVEDAIVYCLDEQIHIRERNLAPVIGFLNRTVICMENRHNLKTNGTVILVAPSSISTGTAAVVL